MNKQNKGITLVALVITIVVLVILVGVSVSVSINTGLIEKSKMVVADYDKAQKDEEKMILDTTMNFHFIKNGIDREMKEGILRGNKTGETVQELTNRMPEGYVIGNKDGEVITDKSTIIATGMTIIDEKDNRVVGRVVILGNLVDEKFIDGSDGSYIDTILAGYIIPEDYEKIAADINRDGIIDETDSGLTLKKYAGLIDEFPNEGYTGSASDIVLRSPYLAKDNYREEAQKTLQGTTYTIGKTNRKDSIKGVEKGTAVSMILEALPANTIIRDVATKKVLTTGKIDSDAEIIMTGYYEGDTEIAFYENGENEEQIAKLIVYYIFFET